MNVRSRGDSGAFGSHFLMRSPKRQYFSALNIYNKLGRSPKLPQIEQSGWFEFKADLMHTPSTTVIRPKSSWMSRS